MAYYLLQAKYMLTMFWAKIVYYANYLMNLDLSRVVYSITLVEKWCGKKPQVGHLKTFICVALSHTFDVYRRKLDEKTQACIMMGYYEETKFYQLFDPIKQQIIIRIKMIIDEGSSRIKLLNYSSSLLHSDPFGNASNNGSTIPFLSILTSQLTYLPESTGSQLTPTKIVTYLCQTSKRTNNTTSSYIPQCDVKTHKSIGYDVGDISSSQQTRIQKQQTIVGLMTCALDTFGPNNYIDAKAQYDGSELS